MNMNIFVDMDQVLTDFSKAVTDIKAEAGLSDNAPEPDKIAMYKAIDAAGIDFWSKMEWAAGGKQLWEVVKPFKPAILSSPGDFKYAVAGKTEWMKNNLPGVTYYFDKEKSQWADRDAILIDDNKNNVGAWQEAGGVGILYENVPDTEAQLLKLLWS